MRRYVKVVIHACLAQYAKAVFVLLKSAIHVQVNGLLTEKVVIGALIASASQLLPQSEARLSLVFSIHVAVDVKCPPANVQSVNSARNIPVEIPIVTVVHRFSRCLIIVRVKVLKRTLLKMYM